MRNPYFTSPTKRGEFKGKKGHLQHSLTMGREGREKRVSLYNHNIYKYIITNHLRPILTNLPLYPEPRFQSGGMLYFGYTLTIHHSTTFPPDPHPYSATHRSVLTVVFNYQPPTAKISTSATAYRKIIISEIISGIFQAA